jgi:hypothetical protein
MIVTVSLRKENSASEVGLSYSVAFGPLDTEIVKSEYGAPVEQLVAPSPEEFKKAVYAALKQVGDKALTSKWIQ